MKKILSTVVPSFIIISLFLSSCLAITDFPQNNLSDNNRLHEIATEEEVDIENEDIPSTTQFNGSIQSEVGLLNLESFDSKNSSLDDSNQSNSLLHSQITFVRDGDIWFINSDGLDLEQLTTSGNYKAVSWSPDGEKLAFIHTGVDPDTQRSADEVGVYDLSTNSEFVVVLPQKTGTVLDRYYDYYNPRWSKDSDTIYFIKRDGRVGGDYVHTVNIETLQEDIGFSPFFSRGFDISPLDNRIVYIDFSNAIPAGYNLNLANADGSGRYPLFPILDGIIISGVTWSQNGNLIIFSAQGGSYGQGSVVTILSDSTIQNIWPAEGASIVTASPDTNYIAYQADNNIFILNTLSGESNYLVGGTYPSWNPTTIWLLMFYIAGDNNLSNTYDKIINYIEKGAGNKGVKIIVLWDQKGNNNSAYYEIKHDSDLYNLATYEEGVDKWHKGELNTGDPSTVLDFLVWAMSHYPAENYALIMDDHGSGLGGGMTDDTSNGDALTLNEMQTALTSVVTTHQKLDVLVMNACLMALIEDGYEFRDIARYYVASEDIQTVYYQGYTDTLNEITNETSELELAKAFVDGYASEMNNKGSYFTMSVVDLEYCESLKNAVENLAKELNFGISAKAVKIWDIRENHVQKFPSQWIYRLIGDEYIDLYHFAELIYDKFDDLAIKNAAQNLMIEIDKYVVCNSNSFQDAHGVSIFFPDIKSSYYTGENNDFATGTNWSKMTSLDHTDSDSGVWGNFLVNLFQEIDPNGPDNPNPPQPMPKSYFNNIYLPLIMK